jgi:hypothetical protein
MVDTQDDIRYMEEPPCNVCKEPAIPGEVLCADHAAEFIEAQGFKYAERLSI